MIFHIPMFVDKSEHSGSQIRPLRMIQAFKDIGYDVEIVMGYCKSRKKQIAQIKKNIKNGIKYDFVYSESSNMPTALTERHHFPICPFLDFNFFRFCKQYRIPIALFYRDIYWKFPQYGVDLFFWKVAVGRFFYRYDVRKYQELVDVLYLPSLNMAKYLPEIADEKIKALPPGFSPKEKRSYKKSEYLNILYVGGIGDYYKMHTLFKVISHFPEVSLTICTREVEWQDNSREYDLGENNNIVIVHKSGYELQKLFAQTDVFSLFVEPQEYRNFAVPVKLFEYLGESKPIIASYGTLAGRFIEDNGIGWTIPYEESELQNLLNSMLTDKEIIHSKNDAIARIYNEHTWEARARQVINDTNGRQQ